eukprot:Filipodium_phascolosomae@DN8775_c0_g1_i1.p1
MMWLFVLVSLFISVVVSQNVFEPSHQGLLQKDIEVFDSEDCTGEAVDHLSRVPFNLLFANIIDAAENSNECVIVDTNGLRPNEVCFADETYNQLKLELTKGAGKYLKFPSVM